MFTLRNISRYKAASAHLAISASIAALVLLIMLALWYPPPLFMAMGGGELSMLIIGVDMVLGPLITLIIFDTRKKELVFDLAIVVAIQLGALGYGVHTMYAARPAFLVFTGQELAVISVVDISEKEQAAARDRSSFSGPMLVAVRTPTDPKELADISEYSFLGLGIQHRPKYYIPYADKRQDALKASKSLTDLKLEPQDKERLDKFVKLSTRSEDKYRYLSVHSENKQLTAIIDAGNGDLVEILDIAPSAAKQ